MLYVAYCICAINDFPQLPLSDSQPAIFSGNGHQIHAPGYGGRKSVIAAFPLLILHPCCPSIHPGPSIEILEGYIEHASSIGDQTLKLEDFLLGRVWWSEYTVDVGKA